MVEDWMLCPGMSVLTALIQHNAERSSHWNKARKGNN
jgi:hypothetical protein